MMYWDVTLLLHLSCLFEDSPPPPRPSLTRSPHPQFPPSSLSLYIYTLFDRVAVDAVMLDCGVSFGVNCVN